MLVHPTVIVHSLADARRALAPGRPVTLLSAPGAGLYAGALWWQALVAAARAEFPAVEIADLLDCGESAGAAMAALRTGVNHLILRDSAAGYAALMLVAERQRASVLGAAPPALDLGDPKAARQLHTWLHARTAQQAAVTGDSEASLG